MSQKQNSSECSGDCSACTQANSCDDPRNKQTGLPERVKMNVKHVILILSGKGGVGKSTVAANLAMALSGRGYSIGLADLDIHGPSIPKMMGIEDKKLTSLDGKKIDPVRITGTSASSRWRFFFLNVRRRSSGVVL
jgi:ATP-binding protein involved in chromosome partitioning